MAENILVLEPGDERAQKIAKAMASQTANDILHHLGEGQTSLADIAERLGLPMNTAKYHLENLVDAGLVTVAETRYSVKGREVKMYALTNQLLIVAPRQSPVRSLILKYASLFGIVALATIGVAAYTQYFSSAWPGLMAAGASYENYAPAAMPVPAEDLARGTGTATVKAAFDSTQAVSGSSLAGSLLSWLSSVTRRGSGSGGNTFFHAPAHTGSIRVMHRNPDLYS
jgi:DNA-binding transcriptional ArsR family regulator